MNPENLNRVRTRELVALLPGIHLRELQRILKTSFTTTRYHVDNLQRDGLILRSEEGKQSRLYPVRDRRGREEGLCRAPPIAGQADPAGAGRERRGVDQRNDIKDGADPPIERQRVQSTCFGRPSW